MFAKLESWIESHPKTLAVLALVTLPAVWWLRFKDRNLPTDHEYVGLEKARLEEFSRHDLEPR